MLTGKGQNMKTLTTDRLVLRPERPEDAEIFWRELGCNEEITRYTGWNPYFSLEAARGKIAEDIRGMEQGECFSWVIERADAPAGEQIIGSFGAFGIDRDVMSIEIGCSIFRNAWGQGFATEAAAAAVRYLLIEAGFNRVHAWCHADNTGTRTVQERAGLRQEGLLRQNLRNPDGSLSDQLLFGILRSDLE